MPVIRIQRGELEKLGVKVEDLEENVRMLGADYKGVHGDEILVEFFPDRPDLYTVEGIARALKQYMGLEGFREYRVEEGEERVIVDESVSSVRPYIVAAVIRGINVDEGLIKSMMDFQEKLHITVGRKRKKIAIGLHDYDRVRGPFTYTTRPKDFSFVPLGFEEEMTLEEIIKRHPKGIEYGDILKGHDRYPVILDSEGNVLSFPPIINGTLTQITEETRNIFIDMTGTDLNALLGVLNIVASSFAERGARIEGVRISYPDGEVTTPIMEYREMSLSKDYAKRLLGFDVGDDEIERALRRMGYRATVGEEITVEIPPYRLDILHPVDIVEDIAKGIGYDTLPRRGLTRYHRGSGFEWENKLRIIMVGLGFLEVKTLTLSSIATQYRLMRLSAEDVPVVVENPVSEGTETLRIWLIPSLMEILRKNKHRDLPQKVFEVGYVRGASLERHLAFLYEDSRVGFTDSKSIVERILEDLGFSGYEVVEKEHPSFIPGRVAAVKVGGEEIGFFGEIHPEVLENFEIYYPVVGGEINLEKLGFRG